jgi:hypothetical protein
MFPLSLLLFSAAPPLDAESRALAYLAAEVPRWSREHHCFSCHNNGDAARALYTAVRFKRSVKPASLEDTTRWLARPTTWEKNGGDGPFNDRKLAAVQFTAALVDGFAVGHIKDRRALEQAAQMLLPLQENDGSWQVLNDGTLGSPITQGNALATHFARDALLRIDARLHADAIRKADAWLRKAPLDTVLDAAAILLALGDVTDKAALAQRRLAYDRFRKGEARTGGWGPYVNSPPEVFDTAVVLLALAKQEPTAETKAWLSRGRKFLLSMQEKDGSWPETTRPSGADSYAQRLSTTSWAMLALLATTSSPRKAP